MKSLNEEISRIKTIMGILVEDEESDTSNHGNIIVQGDDKDSIIIGMAHYDGEEATLLKKEDIKKQDYIGRIKELASDYGWYSEGNSADKNTKEYESIQNFFNELGLTNVNHISSYEPNSKDILTKEEEIPEYKESHMYTFFSNGGSAESGWGSEQDPYVKDERDKLNAKSIKEIIERGDDSLFWDGTLSFNNMDRQWFIKQICDTDNELCTLMDKEPSDENIRKFINLGFLIMWDKRNDYGYEKGNNLLANISDIATKGRRSHIMNNLKPGIYFIGEGHLPEFAKEFSLSI
jgi:hypothetical protein